MRTLEPQSRPSRPRLSVVLLGAAASLALATAASGQANCYRGGEGPGAVAGGPVRVGVTPPPPLPAEVQPPAPAYGYAWTPGYWGWNGGLNDYYWIPGVWIAPPAIGLLWTPPWWGWDAGFYLFHAGYWGPTIGFYGGIDYGFGYFGRGYDGGYWRGRTFFYNRYYNNLGNLRVNAVYERHAADERRGERFERASYNGGRGGVRASPTAAEAAADRQAHRAATPAQARATAAAAGQDRLRAGVNHGRPLTSAAGGPASRAGPQARTAPAAARASGNVAHDRIAHGSAASHRYAGAATVHHTAHYASGRQGAPYQHYRPRPESAHSAFARPTSARPADHAAQRPAFGGGGGPARMGAAAPQHAPGPARDRQPR